MRVLFVIAHLDKGGGQAVQCQQLVSRIRPRLERAELIALSAQRPPTSGPQPDGSDVIGPLRFPGGTRDLAREIRRRRIGFDVVHALDIYYALPAARLARAFPLVVRLGSDPIEDLASRWGRWGRTWMRAMVPWMFEGTEVAVNSPHLLGRLPTGHVRFIPNGVDVERFPDDRRPAEARRELGLPEGVAMVAFTGKVVPRKHLEDIFALLERRPTLHFLLVGELAEPYYGDRYFRRLLADHPSVRARVHAVGEVSPSRIPRCLEAADLFVFPSGLEGMPNSLLEAMASGLPVLASRNPAHEGVVPDPAGALYEGVDDLVGRVDAILADPQRARALGREGRTWVRERFSFDAALQGYLRLYDEALAARP